jgi:outer membrane protein assembly factor BamA
MSINYRRTVSQAGPYWPSVVSIMCMLVFCAIGGQKANSQTVTISFEGTKAFASGQLVDVAKKCLEQYSNSRGTAEPSKIKTCVYKVRSFLGASGYIRATVSEPLLERTETGLKVTARIEEGVLYRLGEVKIDSATIFSPTRIREMLDVKTGDIANAESINEWVFDRLEKAYAELGYIQYTADVEPSFSVKPGAPEGTVDLTVTIDEGRAFSLRSIKFDCKCELSQDSLLGQMLLRSGDIFNRELFDESLKRINQSDQFEIIDKDKDVDFLWDRKNPQLDITVHLKRKIGS